MNPFISTIIVMTVLFAFFWWGKWTGMKTVINAIEEEIDKQS